MKVRELLETKQPPVTLKYNRCIEECMRLLIDNKIGSVIVTDEETRPIGIITERDIFHLAFRYRGDMMDMRVKDIMSSKLIMGTPDDDLDTISEMISKNRIRHIPIMENERLVGIISIRDIVRNRAEQYMMDHTRN
ncbi:MAG: CBS domain-containing protein [Candidatus Zixiibacteriota bacterium]